jgi:hypothetical protein
MRGNETPRGHRGGLHGRASPFGQTFAAGRETGTSEGGGIQPRVGITGQTTITLTEAIERVLANDPDLRISRIQREEAGSRYGPRKEPTIRCWPSTRIRTRAGVAGSFHHRQGTETGKLTQTQLGRRAASKWPDSRGWAALTRWHLASSRQTDRQHCSTR